MEYIYIIYAFYIFYNIFPSRIFEFVKRSFQFAYYYYDFSIFPPFSHFFGHICFLAEEENIIISSWSNNNRRSVWMNFNSKSATATYYFCFLLHVVHIICSLYILEFFSFRVLFITRLPWILILILVWAYTKCKIKISNYRHFHCQREQRLTILCD